MRDFVQIDERDNVAVAVRDLVAGSEALGTAPTGAPLRLAVVEDVPCFHKVALEDIPTGAAVIKYGEYIGVALTDIHAGQYVHVHNVASSDALRESAGAR